MDIDLVDGRYVLAVSGGVVSMVLLELLRQKPNVQLVVAHYDHGIREDSVDDRKLVQETARRYGIQFVYDEGRLGPNTSEAKARKARHDFLEKVRKASKSQGIITAHHQNDLIETALINILRGTGRRGLTSMNTGGVIKRPLLHVTKKDILQYADVNNVLWREDSTNSDTKYLRNHIRHNILPKLSEDDKAKLIKLIRHTKGLNREIDETVTSMLHTQPRIDTIDRHWFVMLPHSVAAEVMTTWLKRQKVKDVNKKMVTKLVNISRTSPPNRIADIDKNNILNIGAKDLKITARNR